MVRWPDGWIPEKTRGGRCGLVAGIDCPEYPLRNGYTSLLRRHCTIALHVGQYAEDSQVWLPVSQATVNRGIFRCSRCFNLVVPEAVNGMIVDHADGLHERIAYPGANKFEAAFL